MSRRLRRETCRDLLMILRHTAPLYGLTIRSNGFVQVDSLLSLHAFTGEKVVDIRRVVQDFSQHLELAQFPETSPTRDELWHIRARNGHTIEGVLIPENPISVADASHVIAVLCTSKTKWKRMKRAGAVQASCGFITFLPRLPESDQVQTVLAILDVGKTLALGIQLFWSTTGKIITAGDAANSLSLTLFSRIELPRKTDRHEPAPGVMGADCLSNNIDLESRKVTDSRRWLSSFISQPTLQRQCVAQMPLHEMGAPQLLSPSRRRPSIGPVACGSQSADGDDAGFTTTPETDSTPVPPAEPAERGLDATVQLSSQVESKTNIKWLIVPVAIPGCGKTGVCAALAYLFDFLHVQVGDFSKPTGHRSARNSYLGAVSAALCDNDVVVADRNNHLHQHRAMLRSIGKSCTRLGHGEVRILVLNWSIRQPSPQAVHKRCSQRILSWRRGQQWFDTAPGVPLHRVLWRFLDHAEPLSTWEADDVIDMDPLETLEELVRRAVDGVVNVMGLIPPTDERIAGAIEAAQAYRPKMRML